MDFLTLWGAAQEPSAIAQFCSTVIRFLIVLFGINALIIVHEFGHFIVARMCGVRCEKFYIWFDAWGFKLFSFKRGDTEYGLGWLPLGGYVKMLGQEDNPAEIKNELERAKQDVQSQNSETSDESQKKIQELENTLYAPDSYQSKNVFQRMAIISAGVIMNVIFAIICAGAAFCIGFPETTSRIGAVLPGTPAWEAGLRAGDEITEMNGTPVTLFAQVPYGIIDGKEVSTKVRRGDNEFTVNMIPKKEADGLMPMVGINPATSLTLSATDHPYMPLLNPEKERAREELLEPFSNDEYLLTEMNGEPVQSPADTESLLRRFIDQPITFTFKKSSHGIPLSDAAPQSVTLPPQPLYETGIRLAMGEIVLLQNDSPAKKAGLSPRQVDENGNLISEGDIITAIDGETITNPLALPYRLQKLATERPAVVVTVLRKGEVVDIPVTLNKDAGYTGVLSHNGVLASDALGISYQVDPVISGVDPTVQISNEGKPIGATIESITVRLPELPADAPEYIQMLTKNLVTDPATNSYTIKISDNSAENRSIILSWFAQSINYLDETAQVTITARQKDGDIVTLETTPKESTFGYRIDRAFLFGVDTRIAKAKSFCDAVSYGWDKTAESMGMVIHVLKNVGRNVSAKAFGGPGMIVSAAWTATSSKDGLFLIFLCVIGANLAVVNILPIPVLDGGHLVFLLYEAIFRKPANETVQVILSFIGLFLLLALMAWVIGLDIARFAGWL